MQVKTCGKCSHIKPISEFPNHPLGKFGVDSRCKECKRAYDKARRDTDEHRAKHAAEEKAWRKANPERLKARNDANRDSIRESSKQCGRRWRRAEPERHLYYKVKYSAKSKNLPFDLEISDIVIPKFCPVFGVELLTGEKTTPCHSNLATVDKLVPSKGYVKGNIRVISFRANRIKCDATLEEIRAVERYLAEALASQSDQASKESKNT